MNVSKSCFDVTFLMVLLIGKLICCSFKFSLVFFCHKQFCSCFVAYMENVPGLKQLLNDVFVKKQNSISLGFLHNFSKKNGQLVGSFCGRFNRDCWICDAHKMLYFFCNQNGIVTFVKVVY